MIGWPLIGVALVGVGLAIGLSYRQERREACRLVTQNLWAMHTLFELPNLSERRRYELMEWRERLLKERVLYCGE